MLSAQVLVLTLIPLLSGSVPGEGAVGTNVHQLLGLVTPLTRDFLVGTWRYTDHFLRWGITDKKKASIQRVEGNAFMSLRGDGTMTMVNLFWPPEGRWELCDQGIIIHDTARPERGSQLIPVRKRDDNRIWLLLPYSGGANGIWMVRVAQEAPTVTSEKSEPRRKRGSSLADDPWVKSTVDRPMEPSMLSP